MEYHYRRPLPERRSAVAHWLHYTRATADRLSGGGLRPNPLEGLPERRDAATPDCVERPTPRGDDNPKCNLRGTSPTSGAEEPHIRPQDVTLDPHRGVSDSPKDGIPARPVSRTLRNAHTFTHQPFFMCICIWCFLNLSQRSITASCCLYRIVVYGIVVMFINKKKVLRQCIL